MDKILISSVERMVVSCLIFHFSTNLLLYTGNIDLTQLTQRLPQRLKDIVISS